MYAEKMDPTIYPFVGDMPKKKTLIKEGQNINRGASKGPQRNRFADMTSNPRLFTFIIGGMSHHEIVSIENLQKEIPA